MEYDIKSIAIYTIIATLIASIIDAVFFASNIVAYSSIIAIAIAGVIIGFLAKNLETAGFAGGIAGFIVSILQSFIAPIFLKGTSIHILDSYYAIICVDAICGAGVSLIMTRND